MSQGGANPVSASDGMSAELQTTTEQDRRALQMMVDYVRSKTRADGCAVALRNGAHVEAQASIGIAPEVGALVYPDSGLSGECLRTGAVVECKDTSFDPRTDAEACRAAQIASVLVVPITVEGTVAGVLEAFSSSPYNFFESDVELMQSVANVIAALVCQKRSS